MPYLRNEESRFAALCRHGIVSSDPADCVGNGALKIKIITTFTLADVVRVATVMPVPPGRRMSLSAAGD